MAAYLQETEVGSTVHNSCGCQKEKRSLKCSDAPTADPLLNTAALYSINGSNGSYQVKTMFLKCGNLKSDCLPTRSSSFVFEVTCGWPVETFIQNKVTYPFGNIQDLTHFPFSCGRIEEGGSFMGRRRKC